MALTAKQVQELYLGYYGRPADPVGLAYWQTQTLEAAMAGFAASAEFTNQYAGMTVEQQVNQVYVNLLGRPSDLAGLLYWSGEIVSGRETIGTLVMSMQRDALGRDVTTLQMRADFAEAFTNALDTTDEVLDYSGQTAAAAAREAMADIVAASTGDTSTLTTALANLDSTVAGVVAGGGMAGQTYTLTTGVDLINGTSGNDTILVPFVNTLGDDATTWTAFDQIDGGAGTDTMNVFVRGAFNSAQPATAVNNVEIINLDNTEATTAFGGTAGIDASKFVGAQQIWQINAANDVNKLAATTTAGFRGEIQDIADAGEDSDFFTVTGADDATSVSIAFDNVTLHDSDDDPDLGLSVEGLALNTVNLSGTLGKVQGSTEDLELEVDITAGRNVTTLTVNSSVAAETELDLYDNEGSTTKVANLVLNMTGGATEVNLGGLTALKTVDASGSTADIDLDDEPDTLHTITTGSGDDEVNLVTKFTSTVKTATVSTGAGDDTITVDVNVNGISGVKAVVNAGAGDDNIFLDTAADTKLTFEVNAGAGDDFVHVQNGEGGYRPLTDNDTLDGGDGFDTLVVASPTSHVLTSGDYIRLQDAANFEAVRFTGPVGKSATASQLDAAELSNYSQIEVTGDGATLFSGVDDALDLASGDEAWSFVKNIAATQTIVARGEAVLTTAGYNASAATATAKNDAAAVLNLNVLESADIGIFAKSANITVDTTEYEGDVTLYIGDWAPSDLDSAVITLVSTSEADEENEGEGWDYLADVWVDAANAGAGFTSLTIKGTGYAYVDNTGGKLTTIDASELGGEYVYGENSGDAFDGLEFIGDASVKETVKVGSGIDDITIASRAGSPSLDKMDTITGLSLSLNDDEDDFGATSDVFTLDLTGFTAGAGGFVKHEFTTTPASIGAAFNTVSALANNKVVFQFAGDTYIFIESDAGATANANFEAGDFAVKLTGLYDLDMMVTLADLSLVA